VRIFKTRWFVRYARRQRIEDALLVDAIERAGRGLIDTDLGSYVIKQRIARQGKGRSGGYRTLVAFRSGARAVFLYGFAKSERENIDVSELATLKEIAAAWMAADETKIAKAIAEGLLQELEQ
jgi:hypothetical protein